MTTQLTIKQSIQADFDAYIKQVQAEKLSVKRRAKVDAFKTSWTYGDLDLQVTPEVLEGKIFVIFTFGEYGCASGYHPLGSPETFSLEKAIEVLDEMKSSLGETVYHFKYSGYQMGIVLDEIKESLLSI